MEQIEQYVAGERDYINIKGGTGPLVYPAGHVYIYLALYHITNKGTNILLAQGIFGLLYLSTLALVMSCYKRAKAGPSPGALEDTEIADSFTGTSIHLPLAHSLQTSPQHLCPPSL